MASKLAKFKSAASGKAGKLGSIGEKIGAVANSGVAADAIASAQKTASDTAAKAADLTTKDFTSQIQKRASEAKENALDVQNRLNNTKAFRESVGAIQDFFDIITKPFRKVGNFIFRRDFPIAHYITLAIVIIVLFGGFSFAFSPAGAEARKRWSDPNTVMGRFVQKFMPGYKMNLIAKNLSPYSGEPPTTDRPVISGRCDEINWKESRAGGAGLCTKTAMPTKIRWTMNVDKQPELSQIPKSVQDIITNKGQKFIVNIPWKSIGMSYVPDVSKATFADGTSATHLFIDNGLTIKKKENPRTVYYTEYRPYTDSSKYVDLATFASENNPMCN